VGVVLPTLREAGSVLGVLERLAAVRELVLADGWSGVEVVVVDDASGDGTRGVVEGFGKGREWVRFVERGEGAEGGLAGAVVEGFGMCAGAEVLVVMDADGSHPPERMVEMLRVFGPGGDGVGMVFGSRFCEGGSTDAEWTVVRRVNSWLATVMARPFTRLRDPMSGYFAVRRGVVERAARNGWRPVGYKIGLEVLVRGLEGEELVEVPIHFRERRVGESKLSVRVRWEYVMQLWWLGVFVVAGRLGGKARSA
jgi:dolichol-phosphate mannosyltransferase